MKTTPEPKNTQVKLPEYSRRAQEDVKDMAGAAVPFEVLCLIVFVVALLVML